jgi:hypothetical protein
MPELNYILLIKHEGKLFPAYDRDRERLNLVKENEIVVCDLDDKRNLRFHRKYFAMLNFVFENMSEDLRERIPSVQVLRSEIMRIMGKVEVYYTLDGKRMLIPESISFAKMGEKKFERVYSDTIDVCLKYFLPEVDKEDFELELLNFA